LNRVICEYCFEPIATVDIDDLAVPMKPKMFKSLDAARQIPPPFPEGVEWLDFHCPVCRLRPFYCTDQITVIDEHYNRSTIKIKPRFVCECGKEYQHESSLTRHKKEAHGE